MAVILALHGVSNRNEKAFAESVRRLAEGLGRAFGTEVRPVFWGDLGPEPVDRLLSVPGGDEGPVLPGTRAMPALAPPVDPGQAKQLADDTVAALAARTGSPVPPDTVGQIQLALEEAAARGAALALQADLADALAEALAAAEPAGEPEVRMKGVAQGVGTLVGKL
ncbi:MAG TPA: hypothetical protein VFO65_11755, partial [Acidimicrobiales bacterium]|nr:hypothetical protein [Acidimicrobiales bacterium]